MCFFLLRALESILYLLLFWRDGAGPSSGGGGCCEKKIQVAYKRKGNQKEVAGFLVNLKSSSSWHMTSLTSDLVTFQSYKSLKDESKSPNLQTTNTIRSFLPKPNEHRRHPDTRFFSRLLVLVMNRSCKKWVGASDWLADLAAERGINRRQLW